MSGRVCKAAICFSATSAEAGSLCRQAETDIKAEDQTYTDRQYDALIEAAETFNATVMKVIESG